MKICSGIVACLATLLISQFSFAQQDLHKQPVGTLVKSHFAAGKLNIFLPEGNWTLIGASETATWPTNSAGRIRWANLWLAFVDGKNLRALVRVGASLDAWTIFEWTGKSPCERTDVVFANYISRGVQDSYCVVVNHRTDILAGKGDESSFGRQAYLWLEKEGVQVPNTMIVASFHRSSRHGNALNLHYYFNPEFDGFPPSSKAAWSTNDWHTRFLDRDSKKVAYVNAIKTWTTTLVPVVEQGYRGEYVEVRTYSKWPLTKIGAQALGDQGSPEDRLRTLKSAYDQGLLSREEYEAKRKAIIDRM